MDAEAGAPVSQTALTAAAARAAHLIVDQPPVIFADTMAAALLGDLAEEYLGYHRAHGEHLVLSCARGQVTCRSRYAEDSLAAAAGRGIRQYVILGAGLDSFGYRSALAGRVRTFEVDHPATQDWKRGVLSAARVTVPPGVTFVPADLEAVSLPGALERRGFDLSEPAFVSWLGVTMYLTPDAIGQACSAIGGFAAGTELVADYLLPAGLRDEMGKAYADLVGPVAADRGEPWLSTWSAEDMSALLKGSGFGSVAHVCQEEIGDPVTWRRSDSIRPVRLSLLAHAVAGAGWPAARR